MYYIIGGSILKILIFILLAVGAAIAYLSKYIIRLVRKTEPTEEQIIKLKLVGLSFVIVAVILVFVFLR